MSMNLPAGPQPSQADPGKTRPTADLFSSSPPPRVNTFGTLVVLPFNISPTAYSNPDPNTGRQKAGGQGRAEAEGEIKEGFRRLMSELQNAGLEVTTRTSGDGHKVWVFVGAKGRRMADLAARERREDFLHSVTTSTRPTSFTSTLPEADQIRLVVELISTNTLQGGLGITPGKGAWRRVEGVVGLHNEQANHAWVQSWLTKRWTTGLFGLGNERNEEDDRTRILDIYGPSVALYFAFVSFYAQALGPLSVVGIVFWLGSKGTFGKLATMIGLETWAYTGGMAEAGYGWSWSWLYAAIVGIWGIAVTEGWRIKERKLSVQFGTFRVTKVDRLRAEYLRSLPGTYGGAAPSITAIDALNASHSVTGDPTFIGREVKILTSVPVIAGLGLVLGALLTAIFIFEAFLSKLYDGPGKSALGLIPTLMFVGVVPNVLAIYHSISARLTDWENHPTKSSHTASLTVKTFAMNAIVAYLGLFLSAFIYVPFGELIMAHFSKTPYTTKVPHMQPEQTGLGPRTSVGARAVVKTDRLSGQLFAYTVTNQAINAFTELGMPYIKDFIANYREQRADDKSGRTSGTETTTLEQRDPRERTLLKKIDRELGLIEYSNFTDYAEMVTQFGYITVWSVVWPLAPLFALINNWLELRTDAAKISTHVRRPIAERVESIGPWLQTMSFITWLSFVTSSTLCYLFRPNLELPATEQSINPNLNLTTSYSTYGSGFLHTAIENALQTKVEGSGVGGSAYLPSWMVQSPMIRNALPMFIPAFLVALIASHAYFVVRLGARQIAEKLVWEPSPEAKALEMSEEAVKRNFLQGKFEDGLHAIGGTVDSQWDDEQTKFDPTFWRGIGEGTSAIASALKHE